MIKSGYGEERECFPHSIRRGPFLAGVGSIKHRLKGFQAAEIPLFITKTHCPKPPRVLVMPKSDTG